MGDRLAGKVAVVTGGASGIGAATARRFVEEGAKVVVADRQVDAGRQVAESLGDAAVAIACDVTDEAQVEAAVALAVSRWGRLDVMFNNAGVLGAVGSVADTDGQAWRTTIDVLLNSVFYGSKHAAKVMIPQGSGSIIATSSVAGVIGGLGPHAYSAAKTAIVGFTKSIAVELAQHGIRVNAIAPGSVPTPLTAQALVGDVNAIEAITAHAKKNNPLGFEVGPLDIANAALYLASDESQFVSGHTLVVDGGRSINGGSARFASSRAGFVDASPVE